MQPRLDLGAQAVLPLEWRFDELRDVLRVCLINCDESGSMHNDMHRNAALFETIARLFDGRFDLVIVHGFGSDSVYRVFTTPAGAHIAECLRHPSLSVVICPSPARVTTEARGYLRGRSSWGTTDPRTHPEFLRSLADTLDGYPGTLDLIVASSSDGGFDSAARQAPIREQMLRVTARCRCVLAANLLVGSAGSPEALFFFTGDSDAFDARLLFSTAASPVPGVLDFGGFDPDTVEMPGAGEGRDHFTVQPATPLYAVEPDGGRIHLYWPTGQTPPPAITVRRHQSQAGGRELVMKAEVKITPEPVTIDRNARAVFGLVAKLFTDNPYLREASREGLNAVLSQLEGLLGTRDQTLARLTAQPGELDAIRALEARLRANTAAFAAARRDAAGLRDLSARINALNNARRLVKEALREATATQQQRALEREEVWLRGNPDHWVVWLAPVMEIIGGQLEATQKDVGDAMAHLSTRIRTRKSREDGQARAADRYVDKLLARTRARQDVAARKRARFDDDVALESPAAWLTTPCPITGAAPAGGEIFGLPFVADRRDITSGNLSAGAQNVDRMPVARDALFSMAAIRGLMWAPQNGQMAAPYVTANGVYNAAIPVLLGPAKPSTLHALERAIGWLCTGTSAFEPPMAEVVPAALGGVLGPPGPDAPVAGRGRSPLTRDEQAHALLRTTALFRHFRSYPYVANTATLDESAKKAPLPEVWSLNLIDMADGASSRNAGCASSVLARAVGAEAFDVEQVARGLFAWCCRNVARAILGASAHEADGDGGLEGLLRLAALVRLDVALEGEPEPDEGDEAREVASMMPLSDDGGTLDAQALSVVLGPVVSAMWQPDPMPTTGFTAALNGWMQDLDGRRLMEVVDELDGIFRRLDAFVMAHAPASDATLPVRGPVEGAAGEATEGAVFAVQPGVAIDDVRHDHFDILHIDALSPVRFSTPPPRLADRMLAGRRMLKGGVVRWIPPRDARLPEGTHNPAVLSWLNGHTAMYPLRALLRLHAAGLLGRDAIEALRAEAGPPRAIPRCDDVIGALADLIGGVDEVVLLMLRAFAFVVDNAYGYADNQWTESPLRQAGLGRLAEILELPPAGEPGAARRYGPRAFAPPKRDHQWPALVGRGYLPKSREVDHRGEAVGPPIVCPPEEAARLGDEALCQLACGQITARVAERDGDLFIANLHRGARHALGSHPEDLRGVRGPALEVALRRALVPVLAGRVKGVPEHPAFFDHCLIVLGHLIEHAEAEGFDTRAYQSEEPDAFLAEEAARIRAVAAGA